MRKKTNIVRLVIAGLLALPLGCASGGWLRGSTNEVYMNETFNHAVDVNGSCVHITVPRGGRENFAISPGPILLVRPSTGGLVARTIFSQQYGSSSEYGRGYGAFLITLDLVALPFRVSSNVPGSAKELCDLFSSVRKSKRRQAIVQVGASDWVLDEVPFSLNGGYSYLYSRRLDDDVILRVTFTLDHRLMENDPDWLEERRRDIEKVLGSVSVIPSAGPKHD